MRHFINTAAIAIACALLCFQPIDARGRNDSSNGGGRERPAQSAPKSLAAPHRQQQTRQQQTRQQQTKPTNNKNNNVQRPGNNGLGVGNITQPRPGNNGLGIGNINPANRPGNVVNPNPTPGNIQHLGKPHGTHFGTPYRPMLPSAKPWAPPMRPAGLHISGGPIISSILGVALGTAIGITLNSLVNQGYNVTGYVDNAIYVADAMQLNLLWPNATLYYNNGGLSASEFFYSTPFYDLNRYNAAYTRLVNTYGNPYSTNALAGGGMNSMWWGPNGQFIQLQFNTGTASNGTTRYFTTLSFGN